MASQAMEERLAALTDMLEQGVQEIYTSGRYGAYLSMMAKFHQYSFGNIMLIFLQCPHATQVAGYTKWKKDFGRNVKRGEKGIQILAPCPYRKLIESERIDPDTGLTVCGADGTVLKETQLVTRAWFKPATVFDVSQTEGRELPTLGVSELSGQVEQYQERLERLYSYAPVPVVYEDVQGAAKGYFSAKERRIVLRPGMSQTQTIKTLVHEISHAKLHDPETVPQEEQKSRAEREVEAESVAYVVCRYLGIDTSEYSFGYVAGWSQEKKLEVLKGSLDRIRATAAELIRAVEPPTKNIAKAEPKKEKFIR